jgi:hypothetical protein
MDISRAQVDINITAPAWQWMALHGYCCLALGNPDARASASATEVRKLLHEIGALLQAAGLLTADEVEQAERHVDQEDEV